MHRTELQFNSECDALNSFRYGQSTSMDNKKYVPSKSLECPTAIRSKPIAKNITTVAGANILILDV